MIDYRCPHPHPRLAGKRCNALLFKCDMDRGQVGVVCWRCHRGVGIVLGIGPIEIESHALTVSPS